MLRYISLCLGVVVGLVLVLVPAIGSAQSEREALDRLRERFRGQGGQSLPGGSNGGSLGAGALGNRGPVPAPDGPSITLTIEPAVIYEGDRVTVRWEVRPRATKHAKPKGFKGKGSNGKGRDRDAHFGSEQTADATWNGPVSLRASFHPVPALPARVGSSGSFSFTAGPAPERGTFTVSAGAAISRSEKTIEYRARLKPTITRIGVEERPGDFRLGERVAWGERFEIVGTHFEDARGDGRVVLKLNDGQSVTMPVESWRDGRIVVRVPESGDNKPHVRRGTVRVLKGPRRLRLDFAGPQGVGRDPSLNGPRGAVGRDPNLGGSRGAGASGSTRGHWDDSTLASNEMPLRVLGKTVVTNQRLQAMANVLLFADTQIHLSSTEHSTVTFSDPVGEAIRLQQASFQSPVTFEINNVVLDVPEDDFWGNVFFREIVARIKNMDTIPGTMEARITGGQVCLTAHFESDGREVDVSGYGREFRDVHVGHFQVDNAVVTVRLRPTVSGGKVTCSAAEASFCADVDWSGSGDRQKEDLLRTKFRDALTRLVDNQGFKNAVGSALQGAFAPSARVVSSAVGSGDSITIKWESENGG